MKTTTTHMWKRNKASSCYISRCEIHTPSTHHQLPASPLCSGFSLVKQTFGFWFLFYFFSFLLTWSPELPPSQSQLNIHLFVLTLWNIESRAAAFEFVHSTDFNDRSRAKGSYSYHSPMATHHPLHCACLYRSSSPAKVATSGKAEPRDRSLQNWGCSGEFKIWRGEAF